MRTKRNTNTKNAEIFRGVTAHHTRDRKKRIKKIRVGIGPMGIIAAEKTDGDKSGYVKPIPTRKAITTTTRNNSGIRSRRNFTNKVYLPIKIAYNSAYGTR